MKRLNYLVRGYLQLLPTFPYFDELPKSTREKCAQFRVEFDAEGPMIQPI